LCTSKDSSAPKYIIEAWIRHLFGVAAGKNLSTHLLKLEKNNILFNAESSEKSEAIEILSSLVDLYLEGCNNLFAYDPGFEVNKNYKNFISSDFLDKYPSLAARLELFNEDKMKADTNRFSAFLLEKIHQFQNLIPHTT
jgi:exonuclease V gamma subunit